MRARVGDQPRHGRRRDGQGDRGHGGEVRGRDDAGGGRSRAAQPAEEHPERMAGVDAPEHRGARAPLELRALCVERHVDDAVGGRERREGQCQRREPGRQADEHEPGGVGGEGAARGGAAAVARGQACARGQPGDGPGLEPKDRESELPGR